MNQAQPRLMQIFLEVFESLPRQGPGNRACAQRALGYCDGLPAAPDVLDLGCGVGGQTLHLAELTEGVIIAVDSHAPSIERLRMRAIEQGLTNRVKPMVGDIAEMGLPPASFDLIWSEGALYNIGIEKSLNICQSLLRPNGFVAFTDAVWRSDERPSEVTAMFEEDYPEMGHVADLIAKIEASGLTLVSHFPLPSEAWWDDFYTPMEARIQELRSQYVDDPEALDLLNQVAQEPEQHRRYSQYYDYEFFVTRLLTNH